MPQVSHIHNQTEWLKNRLDEMDASIAHFESNFEKVSSAAGSKAADLITDMKSRRESFKHWLDQKEEQGEQAWDKTKAKLENEWEGFEDSVEHFIKGVEDKAKTSNATFKARAASQRQAWKQAIERAKTVSHSFQESRKADVTKAVNKLESEAHKVGEVLKDVNDARHESWSAMRIALSESREAFDHAVAESKTAFNIAAKMNTGA